MTRTSLSNLTAIYWNKFLIDIKTIDIIENPKTIADWLRYHRQLNNISRRQLEINSGVPLHSIKKYEDKGIYPSREVSRNLASYFKLSTSYFYDPMYEDKVDVSTALKKYRDDNNLTIKSASESFGVAPATWSGWENERYIITRENYMKLKSLGIIP